jgi:uncharacterized protein (TIGR02996 family)
MTPYDLPDYHALVNAIRQAERDGHDHKLVRLITADWLEEHGEEDRAHYIRQACEDQHGRQYTNSLAILAEQRPVKDLPPVGDEFAVGGQLRWGSIHWISCRMNWWMENGPYLVRRHPVTAIHITDKTPWPSGLQLSWWKHGATDALPQWTIPAEVFDFMADGDNTANTNSKHYWTTAHATNALHDAALTWAESQPHPTP